MTHKSHRGVFAYKGAAGASPRPTNLSQIRHRQYGVSVNDVGADAHIGSDSFICPLFRIHLPNTAHLSCNSANIGCNLYNIVSDLSIYRLLLQKSAVSLDKKMNSRIMVCTRFEIQRRY